MAFRPGQLVRNYSVSCAPGQDSYRISVKREGAPDDAPRPLPAWRPTTSTIRAARERWCG